MNNLTRDITNMGDLTRDITNMGDLTRDISTFGLQNQGFSIGDRQQGNNNSIGLNNLTRDITNMGLQNQLKLGGVLGTVGKVAGAAALF